MKKLGTILLSTILFFSSSYANAESAGQLVLPTVCGPHDEMVSSLKDDYGETRFVIAITKTGGVFELYKSDEKNTWTAVVTAPDGTACLLVGGEDLEVLLKKAKKGPEI